MKSMNQACTTACPLADLRALRDASAVLKKVPSPMRKILGHFTRRGIGTTLVIQRR
jgi:hypothetical protein